MDDEDDTEQPYGPHPPRPDDSDPPTTPFSGDDERDAVPNNNSRIEHIKLAFDYIKEIENATLENGKLEESVINRLRNPLEGEVDISDPDTRLSLDLYLACVNASEDTYNNARIAILRRFPECNVLSYHLVKSLAAEITGVVSVLDDMCINSCEAFVGPKANHTTCSTCSAPRYTLRRSKHAPQQQVLTIPLGPQIQALRRSTEGATAMAYRQQKVSQIVNARRGISAQDYIYDDIFSGRQFLEFSEQANLGPNDTTVIFSLDGAQLYHDKKSDTWIGIWIIADYNPKTRYKKKHVLPALVVPGPNKPKDLDSFLFRSFHHVSALQRENGGTGFRIWNALSRSTISSRLYVLLATADAVGLTELDGRVGHHGAQGCRISCDMKGRHKPNSGHYYAVHLRPSNNNPVDCNHDDYNFRKPPSWPTTDTYRFNLAKVVASSDQGNYEKNRKLTGISRPSILLGLHPNRILPIPTCFTVDLMHLLFINLGELIVSLWRGTMKCEVTDDKRTWDWMVLTDAKWEAHGRLVAAATKFFPSSFHRPPRNPAEKINSGYKATEYFLYLFGLGPALFRIVLPEKYWQHFCQLVHAIRIIIQRKITAQQLREAHYHFIKFVEDYELMYYQRRMDRLHFCRPCLHTLLHTASEADRIGPGCYTTQYTMERAIGYLGALIRQSSNIFGNLCQIALRQAQINALKAICPNVDPDRELPSPSHDCGSGFVLLGSRSRRPEALPRVQANVLAAKFGRDRHVRKWGRLLLPNGQIARSIFKETNASDGSQVTGKTRVSRNVKVDFNISDVFYHAKRVSDTI